MSQNFGMVGLGRMGANIVRRLQRAGITSVVYDVNADAVAAMVAEGAIGASDLKDFASKLSGPRKVWVMVPASVTNQTIDNVAAVLDSGDTIIDGGNTFYRDDIANAAWLATKGINFVDVGTSGGVYGLERGYSLMIGGDKSVVDRLNPIFKALAPGFDAAERTPGRARRTSANRCEAARRSHTVRSEAATSRRAPAASPGKSGRAPHPRWRESSGNPGWPAAPGAAKGAHAARLAADGPGQRTGAPPE